MKGNWKSYLLHCWCTFCVSLRYLSRDDDDAVGRGRWHENKKEEEGSKLYDDDGKLISTFWGDFFAVLSVHRRPGRWQNFSPQLDSSRSSVLSLMWLYNLSETRNELHFSLSCSVFACLLHSNCRTNGKNERKKECWFPIPTTKSPFCSNFDIVFRSLGVCNLIILIRIGGAMAEKFSLRARLDWDSVAGSRSDDHAPNMLTIPAKTFPPAKKSRTRTESIRKT